MSESLVPETRVLAVASHVNVPLPICALDLTYLSLGGV